MKRLRLSPSAVILLASLAITGCSHVEPVDSVPPGRVMVFGHVDYDWRDGALSLNPMVLIPTRRTVTAAMQNVGKISENAARVTILVGRHFYEVIPKEDYLFFEFSENSNTRIRCPGLILKVPRDASAVYVGDLFLHRKRQGLGKPFAMTLSVRDGYDRAIRDFRETHPNFKGKIVTTLFARATSPNEGDVECSRKHLSSNPLETLFYPLLRGP